MNQEKIKRTVALAYVATAITQVAEIGYNYLLYKSFPVDEIGLFAWAAAIIVFFNMATDMGVEPILTRKFGRYSLPVKRAMLATFLLRAPIILVAAAVVTVLYSLKLIGSDKYLMIVLVGGQTIFSVWDGVCKAWLRANGLQTRANFLAATIGILKLAAIIILTQLDSSTIYQLLASLLGIRAAVSIMAYLLVSTTKVTTIDDEHQPLFGLAHNLLKAGVYVGGIGVLGAVQNRFDWLLVSHFISTEALATYSLANKFYEISQLVVGAALTTIYPWLCRVDTDKAKLLVLLRLVLVGGALFGACCAILGPPLVDLIFPGKFDGIRSPLVILMIAVGNMAAGGVLYQVALAQGHERSLLVVVIVSTSLQVAANLWLIPRLGISGAAIGMLLLVVLTSVGVSILVWKRKLISSQIIGRIFAFLAVFIVSTWLVTYFAMPIRIAIAGCMFALAFSGWYLLFGQSERKMLRAQAEALLSV